MAVSLVIFLCFVLQKAKYNCLEKGKGIVGTVHLSDADTDGEEEMRLIIVRGNIKN